MKYYPINYDVAGKKVLVVGGGPVAYRKVRGLLACKADITVVSIKFCPDFKRIKNITRIKRAYKRSDLRKACLVISATNDPKTNKLVSKHAERKGIPANVVDQPENCSFTIPAILSHGDLMITISTGGVSPALAVELRKKVENAIGPEYNKQLQLLRKMRELVLASRLTQAQRSKLLKRFAGAEFTRLVKSKGRKEAEEKAKTILQAAKDKTAQKKKKLTEPTS